MATISLNTALVYIIKLFTNYNNFLVIGTFFLFVCLKVIRAVQKKIALYRHYKLSTAKNFFHWPNETGSWCSWKSNRTLMILEKKVVVSWTEGIPYAYTLDLPSYAIHSLGISFNNISMLDPVPYKLFMNHFYGSVTHNIFSMLVILMKRNLTKVKTAKKLPLVLSL